MWDGSQEDAVGQPQQQQKKATGTEPLSSIVSKEEERAEGSQNRREPPMFTPGSTENPTRNRVEQQLNLKQVICTCPDSSTNCHHVIGEDDHVNKTTSDEEKFRQPNAAEVTRTIDLSVNPESAATESPTKELQQQASSLISGTTGTKDQISVRAANTTQHVTGELSKSVYSVNVGMAAKSKQEASSQEESSSTMIDTQTKPSSMDDSSTEKSTLTKTAARTKRKSTAGQKVKPGQATGRWTREEHQLFLEGLEIYGREWKKVAERIKTRTSAQIRSHAQKYFDKVTRDESVLMHDQPSIPNSSLPVVPSNAPTELSPSEQQTAERILADPSAAQDEVEQTIQALRERYRQLQIRLEMRQQQRSRTNQNINKIASEQDDQVRTAGRPTRSVEIADCASSYASSTNHDDLSTVSSNISASLATTASPQRELVDDEMIALHVLGAALSEQGAREHSSPSLSIDDSSSAGSKRMKLDDSDTNGDEGGSKDMDI